jgi:hypothetical protein
MIGTASTGSAEYSKMASQLRFAKPKRKRRILLITDASIEPDAEGGG